MTESLHELPVLLDDLEMFRTTMLAVQTFLEAQDMAKSQLNMLDKLHFSPLTQDVQHGVKRIEGLIGDYLVANHFQEASEVVEPEAEEELPALPENPLGKVTFTKAPKMVADDAQLVSNEINETS